MKFTKGPWGIFKICPYVIGEINDDNTLNRVIAMTDDKRPNSAFYGISEEERNANTQLICAAPDLYNVCMTLILTKNNYEKVKNAARSVIKKANGKNEKA